MADNTTVAGYVLSSFLLCSTAVAIGGDSANPYQGIVDRNVFGLKPPPEPPKPEEKKPDLPPITLTGITTILGNKRALMTIQAPGKPIQSFIIAEGQRDGELEVLEIDEKAGVVKVSQSGTVQTLNFEKNGPKLTASAPPPMPNLLTNPGNPGGPPVPHPTPVPYVPGAPPPVSTGLKTIPTRQLRLSQPGTPGPAPAGGFSRPQQPFNSGPPVPGQ